MPFLKHKVFKYFIRVILGLFALLVISSVLLLWRLSMGPIQLDKLTPRIQKIVSDLPGDFEVQIKGIGLVWNRQQNVIQLEVTEVALVGENDLRIVAAPTAKISISISALMNRVIALSAIELRGVSVHVIRNEDGSLQLGKKTDRVTAKPSQADQSRDTASEFHDLTIMLENTFKVLQSAPDPQYPLSYLSTIDLQGDLTAENRKLDMEFRFTNCVFSFRGKEHSIAGDLALSIESPQALAGIDLKVSLDVKGKEIDADINVSGVNLSKLSTLGTRLEILEKIDLYIDGTVSGKMTLPDIIHSVELDIHSDAGSIALDQFIPHPIDISSFNLKAEADPSEGKLDLSRLSLVLGNEDSIGPKLHVSGVVNKADGFISVAAETRLEQLEIEDLADYWPADLVTDTRTWLTENLQDGKVDSVKLDIGMKLPTGNADKFALEKLEGEISYSNLSVYFLRPMPPVTGVTGSGSFNQQGFDLSIDAGLIEGIKAGPGRVQISGLDEQQVALNVDTNLDGEIAKALALLEMQPIDLDKGLRFSSADVGGQFNADFHIALPLKSGLSPGEIDYHVNARLTSASVRNFFDDIRVTNGVLEIYDDFHRFDIDGTLDFAGIPITLAWESNWDSDRKMASTINARANEINPGDFSRLGFPVDTYLSGSLAAELNAKISSGGNFEGNIEIDLASSELSLPAIHWTKPIGEQGNARATINISEEKSWSIRDFGIEAGTLSASGEATYEPVDPKLTFALDSVSLGRTLLQDIRALLDPENGAKISVAGGQLDLEPLLARDSGDAGPKEKSLSETPSQKTPDTSLSIDISKLDKVFFKKDQALENVAISLEYFKDTWQTIRLNGQYPISAEAQAPNRLKESPSQATHGNFSFNYGPSINGRYPLSADVENLGSLLAATLDNHMINGGELSIDGESSGDLLQSPVNATITLKDFILVEAPLVAQLLNFASLPQTLHTLNSEGLLIESFSGDLLFSDNRLSSDQLRAYGALIGATVGGDVVLDEKTLNLHGSVIPLARIGNVIGKIKPLKHILMGMDETGVVALDYDIIGSFENPEISVNPGSLLTPGALRDIFKVDEAEQ